MTTPWHVGLLSLCSTISYPQCCPVHSREEGFSLPLSLPKESDTAALYFTLVCPALLPPNLYTLLSIQSIKFHVSHLVSRDRYVAKPSLCFNSESYSCIAFWNFESNICTVKHTSMFNINMTMNITGKWWARIENVIVIPDVLYV